ncbi:ATP synthase F1 subunit epsilon [Hujiaoplasma nucleasis]|uniref:ATP synthase epsilon chain n=1 Tax=Hujiaoplasma nucleasis TaxID=2725268 RepID=A0A7L6N6V2_9MOLU|nr:ATP synthase F1 subunit epsilon [Hujiaoplasma nucleasis]QLY40254.1 ATP synthase F1 subunit epsilon [Hujiaoplasma nucleasis]
MDITIVTPDGELYKETVNSIIVSSSNNGNYEILPDHLPIVSTIDTGYIKLCQNDLVYFVVVINGIVENRNNQIRVIAQDAYIGKSKDQAMENLEQIRKDRINENKKRNIELAKAEKELQKQIKQTGAGSL